MTKIKEPGSFYPSQQRHFRILSTHSGVTPHSLLKIKALSRSEYLSEPCSNTVVLETHQQHSALPETTTSGVHQKKQIPLEQSASSVFSSHILLEALPNLLMIGRGILTTNFVPMLDSVHSQLKHCSHSVQQRPVPFQDVVRNNE